MDRQKKFKINEQRTRAADRTRKGKPYYGRKNLVGSETIAVVTMYRHGDTEYRSVTVYDKIGPGMKPDHASRFVDIKALFPDAPEFKPKVAA